MSTLRSTAIFCAALLVSSVALAKGEPKSTSKEQSPPPQQQQKSAPRTRVTIDEDALMLLFDEPDEHFVKARNSLTRKDLKEAGLEIRKAVVFLKLEADRADGDNAKAIRTAIQDFEKFLNDMDKSAISGSIRKVAESLKQDALKVSGDSAKALQMSSMELEKLADQMEEKAPQASGNEVIDAIVARTHVALVKHHLDKTKEHWGRKDYRRAGNDLDASADNLARAYQWMNKEADGSTKTAFKETRAIAAKMSQMTPVTNDEFTKLADMVAKEFERAGKLADAWKK